MSQINIDDSIQQEADRIFSTLGLDTEKAITIFLKATIENAGMPFPFKHKNLPDDLIEAVNDTRSRKNLHGPFDSAEEAVKSMLED